MDIHQKKDEIMSKWMGRVFPASQTGSGENPLLAAVRNEFSTILDYVLSSDPSLLSPRFPAPHAWTLVRYRALQTENSHAACSYPVHLRDVLLELALPGNGIALPVSLQEKTDRLLFAAFDCLLRAREDIFRVRLDELNRGILGNETGACPSAGEHFRPATHRSADTRGSQEIN